MDVLAKQLIGFVFDMPLYFSVVMGNTNSKAKPAQKRIENGMPPPPRMEWDPKLQKNVLNLWCCVEDRKKSDKDRGCYCTIS